MGYPNNAVKARYQWRVSNDVNSSICPFGLLWKTLIFHRLPSGIEFVTERAERKNRVGPRRCARELDFDRAPIWFDRAKFAGPSFSLDPPFW
jgi:hypothetical protein